jgi:hypothetical protein
MDAYIVHNDMSVFCVFINTVIMYNVVSIQVCLALLPVRTDPVEVCLFSSTIVVPVSVKGAATGSEVGRSILYVSSWSHSAPLLFSLSHRHPPPVAMYSYVRKGLASSQQRSSQGGVEREIPAMYVVR